MSDAEDVATQGKRSPQQQTALGIGSRTTLAQSETQRPEIVAAR
jgi:hypothetical protein